MHFFSRIFLPFLLLSYISAETYLKLQHSSLCGEVGCKLAGELLRFDSLYLNYFGMAALVGLLLLGYYSHKKPLFEILFFVVLYSALAFESVILGYQFFANSEICIFCLGVFSSLLIIALLNPRKNLLLIVPVVFSIILALSALAIPKNQAFVTIPGMYLIQSENCGHCKKVKSYFAQNCIDYTPISIENINARDFLKFLDISSIPVLVINENSNIILLKGDKNIIAYFEEKCETKESVKKVTPGQTQSSAQGVSLDLFGGNTDAGCAITITDTPSCEDKNATLR